MKKLLLILFVLLSCKSYGQDDIYGSADPVISQDSSYNKGMLAAKKNYKGYKGPATTTFIVSILSPILGLAPAIGASSSTPSDLYHSDYDKLKDPSYYKGYAITAKKIRSDKVWKNWAYGTVIDILAIGATYSIINAINNRNEKQDTPHRVIPSF